MKKTLKKIRDLYCYTDFFLNRGLGLFNGLYQMMKYMAFAGIIIGMVNEVIGKFGLNIPMEYVIFFTPVFMAALIAVGIIDVKKIHALQKTNEISTRYNPFLVDLIKNKNTNEN